VTHGLGRRATARTTQFTCDFRVPGVRNGRVTLRTDAFFVLYDRKPAFAKPLRGSGNEDADAGVTVRQELLGSGTLAGLWSAEFPISQELPKLRDGELRLMKNLAATEHGDLVVEHEDLRVLRWCAAGQQSQPGRELPEDQIQQSYRHDR
jgi:hypothetical protein